MTSPDQHQPVVAPPREPTVRRPSLLKRAWRALPLSDRWRWRITTLILWPVLPFMEGSTVYKAYHWEKEWRRRCIRPFAGDAAPELPPQRKPDIYFWGNIDWRFRIQRPQHLALELAGAGHRVFYVSPSFVKTRDAGFELERIDDDASRCIFELRLHLESRPRIYEAVPAPHDLARLQEDVALLFQWTRSAGCVSIVHHPYWHTLARRLPDSRLVYDCIDHHMGFSNMGMQIEVMELDLLKDAEAVVVSSQGLQDAAARHNPRVALIRNAAEYSFFSSPPSEVFRDDRGRRVIGYYGAIADWIDVELLGKVAARFPDCLLLLVGSDTCGARRALAHLSNVRFTGEVPYRRLPHYLYAMDVCLLPFRVIPLTLATNPVKAYEYLAAGKPVAAVALPELEQFDNLVVRAGDHEGFLEAVAGLLSAASDAALASRRQAFAARNTWPHRIEALEAVFRSLPEPPVSVVVVTYNNLHLTRACLASIAQHTGYGNLEVIVVDNASTDGTPEFLREWERGAARRTIVLNAENRGFAAANNQGLALASGEYLVMLNNDTEVTAGWVRTLMAHLRRDPSIGMVGPVTDNIGNEARIPIRYRNPAEMWRKAAAHTLRHMGEAFPIRTLAFFCAMLPRHVYETVGPLDEAYGIGFFEDDDYCRRIEQLGLKLACAEDVFVHHHLSASFNKLGKGRQELLDRNRAIYEAKWGPWVPHQPR